MSNRTVRNLVIVLFALVAIVIGLELSDSNTSPAGAGDRLFSELREQINQLDKVTIDRPQTETDSEQTVIVKNDTGWAVDTRGGYPADVGKVREVLLALADAQILEEKTSNPERYPPSLLGLTGHTRFFARRGTATASIGVYMGINEKRSWKL